MKALLLIAHGSRSASANDEIRVLTAQLRDAGVRFELVECAFLEMTEPNIVQSGNKLVGDGASEIVVLPYFLAAGRHAAEDIPAEVARIAQQHPQIKITIAPHFGAATGMAQRIHAHLRQWAECKSVMNNLPFNREGVRSTDDPHKTTATTSQPDPRTPT